MLFGVILLYFVTLADENQCANKCTYLSYGCLFQEGFGLLSSPGLHVRGAGQDVILPIV